MFDTESINYTTTTRSKWDFPQRLTTCSYIVLAKLLEVLFEATKSVAMLVDDVDTLLLSNSIHLVRCQFWILALAIAIATKAIATSIESDTSTKTLNETLAYTLCALCDNILVWPIAVVFCFLKVSEQYLIYRVTVATWHIYIVCIVWLQTCRNITPSLDKVVVDESTQCQSLTKELSHITVVLNIAILADALDSEVCTLDTLVEHSIGIIIGVHLTVGR